MSLCESPEILSDNHDKKALSSLSHTNVLPSSSFCRSLPSWCVRSLERLRIKFTPEGKKKREFVPHDQVFPLLVVYFSLFLHTNCFEVFCLLIFYFEKFLAWIWRLPFTVYVKLKFSSIIINISILIIIPCEQAHPRPLGASSQAIIIAIISYQSSLSSPSTS